MIISFNDLDYKMEATEAVERFRELLAVAEEHIDAGEWTPFTVKINIG